MPNIYLELYNKKLSAKAETLPVAMQSVLSQFIKNRFPKSKKKINAEKKKLKGELQKFIEHLSTARIGNWVIGYQFTSTLPPELISLFNIARLHEQAILNSPSTLVSDCENAAAGDGFSASEIYKQLVRLESALVKKEVEAHHQEEVQSKIRDWIALLYEKFALIILNTANLDELKTKVESTFDKTICEDLPQLAEFQNEIMCQLEFLEAKDFFDDFYKATILSDKYEFVFEYYQALKTKGTIEPELRATLIHLFYQTINKAYAPCDAQKFNLMRNRGATIEVVFKALQKWAQDLWKSYQETDFHAALTQKLQEDKATYECWEQIGDLTTITTGPRPLYQLHCMKYAGNPMQDPRDLLKQISSPMKPKASSRVLSTQIPLHSEPVSHPVTLLCTGSLEDEALNLPETTKANMNDKKFNPL
ncbi:MAG: hypothetical protein HYX61_01700 [Gammaproteobacteria bacterium]|jgi:hypothetical protein|nr:hypothetical protein [Gammaproteobacteria bacterium]